MSETTPPAFFWYYHCGLKENWNQAQWHDPSMKRPFDDYMNEALEKDWWAGRRAPARETRHRASTSSAAATLFAAREAARTMLLNSLWPNLNKVVYIDWRMNTTGMFSDIILPCSHPHREDWLPFLDDSHEPDGLQRPIGRTAGRNQVRGPHLPRTHQEGGRARAGPQLHSIHRPAAGCRSR